MLLGKRGLQLPGEMVLDIGQCDVPKVCSSLNRYSDGVGHTRHRYMGGGGLLENYGDLP